MIDFKGSQFEREIILWGVRWYVAYPISYRQLEEMMKERGVEVDHSNLNRWVLKFEGTTDQAAAAKMMLLSSGSTRECDILEEVDYSGPAALAQKALSAYKPPQSA